MAIWRRLICVPSLSSSQTTNDRCTLEVGEGGGQYQKCVFEEPLIVTHSQKLPEEVEIEGQLWVIFLKNGVELKLMWSTCASVPWCCFGQLLLPSVKTNCNKDRDERKVSITVGEQTRQKHSQS